jgi:hypothetical protein
VEGVAERAGKAGQRRRTRRLDKAGVKLSHAVEDGPFLWEPTRPGDTDVPTRPALLLQAIS